MKQLIAALLLPLLLFSGCSFSSERIKDPVFFYYPQERYSYNGQSGVIASEEREASGHREDLGYLLALYMMGPSEESLRSAVPEGTKILTIKHPDRHILLTLDGTIQELADADFSLACACLTLTCLELTNAEKVTITCGSRSVTMSRDTITLYDSVTAAPKEDTQ